MGENVNEWRRVALLVNSTNGNYKLPQGAPTDALAEVDGAKYVEAYAAGIRLAGCEPLPREGVPDLGVIEWLREKQPDFCFNVCEGFGGESREAHMPALPRDARFALQRPDAAGRRRHPGQTDHQEAAQFGRPAHTPLRSF